MYGFRRRGRKSVRELRSDSLAAQRMLAAGMAPDDPRREAAQAFLAKQAAAIPPKRHRVVRPVDGRPVQPLERDIQKACLQLLRSHPKVAAVWRQNSGTFTEQNYDGSTRYISAHTMPGLPDICGFLKGGRALFLEVKRPGQQPTRLQQIFLDRATAAGALAAVVTDANQLAALLA